MGEQTGKKNVISSNNISSEAISVIDKRFHVSIKLRVVFSEPLVGYSEN